MRVIKFRMVAEGLCMECGRPSVTHRVNGRWVACQRDVTIGRDQATASRRARLAQIQRRTLKVHPFGIDAEEAANG